ncbi:MAG: hypothetical protein ACRBHB_06250 [Arenicella sp.]
MKKLHLAISTDDIASTVKDYTDRMGCKPCFVVPEQYALWRTESINLSVRNDQSCKPGQLRHLGWEDDNATAFTADKDVNGVLWECFNAQHQAEEIEQAWPGTAYKPA